MSRMGVFCVEVVLSFPKKEEKGSSEYYMMVIQEQVVDPDQSRF